MRRKQLYAMILAGALATGGVPVTAMAADAASETAGEETGDFGSSEDTDNSAAEEQPTEAPAEPTEAPTEPEQPTEAPAEEPAEEPTEAPAEQPAEETTETETVAEENTATGIAIINKDAAGNDVPDYQPSLQAAIDKVEAATSDSEATVIEVSDQLELSSTVTIENKKVCIRAAGDVSIGRADDSFKGDMFQVSGENASLQFEVKDGGKLTVSGAFTDTSITAEGSIVKVTDGSFGLFSNVILTGNNSSAKGAAIDCTNGQIALAGGTITGNTGANGAVYSDSDILVQGTVIVKDNKIADVQANVYLDKEAKFMITNELTGSEISFTHANATDGWQVLGAADKVESSVFESAVKQFGYDTDEYTLNAADTTTKTVTLKKKADTPDPDPEPTKDFLSYKSGTLKWTSHTAVSVELSNTKDCKWYYTYVDSGTSEAKIKKMYDAKHTTTSVKANKGFTVTATNVPEKNNKWLVVFATSTDGTTEMKYFKLDEDSFNKKRPPKEASFLTYKSGTLKWTNHTTVSLDFSTTQDCKWYYFFVDADTSVETIQNMYDSSRATNAVKANTAFTVKAENVPEADSWLVVCAKPTTGKAKMSIFKLNTPSFKTKRPPASNNNTRKARTYSVSELASKSKITGLKDPLKFTPGTFYEFSVTGAGQNDEPPYVSGDERWIPMYWSMKENPTETSDKNTTFRIGSPKGIKDAKTYNIYVFFKKQIYNGSEWQDTDVIESVKTQFSSQELTDADLTITPTGDGDGTGGGSGSGSATDAELTATEAATEKANGSSSKSAVSTMDESPIGTMATLAVLSLLAAGYILIRKRKKDI